MPRADNVPFYQVDHSCQTPCTHNPLGVKGCGEAGAIGSPPAVVNAVVDALRSAGKGKCTAPELDVLNVLSQLMEHESMQVRAALKSKPKVEANPKAFGRYLQRQRAETAGAESHVHVLLMFSC